MLLLVGCNFSSFTARSTWVPSKSERTDSGSCLDMLLYGPLNGLPPPPVDSTVYKSCELSIGTNVPSSQYPTSYSETLAGRARLNADQPINKLPVELLVGILMRLPSIALEPASRTGNKAQCFECMAVCHHWRTVITANPCFWRTIRTGERTRWLDLALARSGDANLRLTFSSATGLIDALPILLPKRDRIEHLDFTCQSLSDVGKLTPLISAPLPCLAELSVSGFEGNSSLGPATGQMLAFHPENFPAIVRLKLVGVTLPWTGAFLSRLRSLDLRRCQVYPSAIPVGDFLSILRRGDSLEELTLHDFLSSACPSTPLPADLQAAPAVNLPRLRKLEVSDTPAWISRFIIHVQLPSRGDVVLTGQIDEAQGAPRATLASLLPANKEKLGFLRSTTSATLVMFDSACSVICKSPGPLSVTLKLRPRTPRVSWVQSQDEGSRHFTALFHSTPLTTLNLQCELEKVSPDVLATVLDAFPQLRELTVTSTMFGPDPFPTHLCDSLRSSPALGEDDDKVAEASSVRCSSLRVLRLERVRWEDGAFLNAVADCLRERERLEAPRLELLEVTASRSPEVDWSEPDARWADVLRPMVGTYSFSGKGW